MTPRHDASEFASEGGEGDIMKHDNLSYKSKLEEILGNTKIKFREFLKWICLNHLKCNSEEEILDPKKNITDTGISKPTIGCSGIYHFMHDMRNDPHLPTDPSDLGWGMPIQDKLQFLKNYDDRQKLLKKGSPKR